MNALCSQKDKYHKICLKKQNIPVRELCKGLPAEFGTLLCYCRNLKFDETPNYNYCRKLLREVFEANGYSLDYVYDWTVKQQVCLVLALSLAASCTTAHYLLLTHANAQTHTHAHVTYQTIGDNRRRYDIPG